MASTDSDFVIGLKSSLEAAPNLRRRGKKILEVINQRPSKRRTRILARMERHAQAAIYDKVPASAFGPAKAIDWSKVDWNKVIMTILDILIKLLPLIIGAM